LYVPRIPGMPSGIWKYPNEFKLEYEDVALESEDGVKLHAWLLWGRGWDAETIKSRPVIIFFQENAGNMSFRLPFLRLLVYRLNAVVFAMSYRGYGLSEGKPSERGIQKDALAGLQYVRSRPDLATDKVVLMGRSLGGAVAVHLAAEQQSQVKAVILENTFTAVQDMVARIVPPLGLLIGTGRPCNFLVTNKWQNQQLISRIKVPMLMMVSLQDEMVPASQMFKLHTLQRSPQCELLQFDKASHMDAYDVEPEKYWGGLYNFLVRYVEDKNK
ncbi:Protein bem46, partial [Tetrabaena socialis]